MESSTEKEKLDS